ncbi:MAG: PD-(D/E)XK motif protein, partial [Thermoanaerobacterales bacterium]|nr:PD-(D/E)XK motif protein [Thermoanaerobacterales bacterium]
HHINGLDQLDHPENGRLYLYSLRIREEPASSNSLVSLIQRIGGLLTNKPELLDLYEERLAQAGYSPLYAERYSQTRFRVVSERLYLVETGFPRLSTSSFSGGLPRGVERVEYEINLEICPHLCVGKSPTEPGINLEP